MATKIEEFLKAKKIDKRRVLAASEKLEKLRPEDRLTRLTRRQARSSEDAAKKKSAAELKKPRSGRPVTPRAISAALLGKDISGPQKTRILAAVNAILVQKKETAVTLKDLFELASKGNPPKEKKAKA